MLGQESVLWQSPFLLCISLGFLLFWVVVAEIPLGSKLSIEENNYWKSSDGDFALGFFNHSNEYSVGIHFNSSSIPVAKQAVVWVAGADLLVGNNSYFQLSQSGELILFDSAIGFIAWTSNTSNASVASAILLDSGNLVLLNTNKDVVWQSFDTPSDTLLPGQNLTVYQMLRAASRNSVSSYYSFHIDISGELQLRWESSVVYWTSGSPSWSILRAILNSDGTLRLLDQRSKSVWSAFAEDHDDTDVKFRFLRLDIDGNLRLYSWVEASKSWKSVWQAVENQCNVVATCGLHGICIFNASGSPVCKCPYTPATESYAKCLAPFHNDCESGSSMIAYEHTSLYGVYPPNETVMHTSLQHCSSLCQEDPLCTAVTFANDGTAQCRMKKTRYISGQSDPSLSAISFVKMCSDPTAVIPIFPNSPPSPQGTSPKNSQNFRFSWVVGTAISLLIAFLIFQLGIGLYICKRGNYARKKSDFGHMDPTNPQGLIRFSFSEIREFSGNFKHQIGPKMFRGRLPGNRLVAIKELNISIEEKKFRVAVSRIGSIFHKDLVKLQGFCCESGHRILVYEFVKNGSLTQCLEDPKRCKRLTWRKRMEICLAVAKVIAYLHAGCRNFVSHGNLKCENIVLDENFEAKVSEFGLPSGVDEAPECGVTGERDVMDFGNLVLTLIVGCLNSSGVWEWVYGKWIEGLSEMLVDERIEGEVNSDELERALRIAFWCLHFDDRLRPSMGEVVMVLEGTLTVDPPPSPFTRHRPHHEQESLESDAAEP